MYSDEAYNEPEQIRRDIEQTQRNLSNDVDALTAKVSPRRIVHRRVDQVRSALHGAKDTVMGTASQVGEASSSAASTAVGRVQSAASSAAEAVSDTPRMVRERTQGNPLAVGLIAFGIGWLLSSLIPVSESEKKIATQVKDKAGEHTGMLKEEVMDAAQQVQANLREPVQQAMESVKSTAVTGTQTVQDQVKGST